MPRFSRSLLDSPGAAGIIAVIFRRFQVLSLQTGSAAMASPLEAGQSAEAFAELLEDGRDIAAEEIKKPKYRVYRGPEPVLEAHVRVQPAGEPAFDGKMRFGLSMSFLLKPGVRVHVRYDGATQHHVFLDDNNDAIIARNPLLIRQ